MDKRILGIDFNDNGTLLTYYSDEKKWYYPSSICKNKDNEEWLVGRAAYESILTGSGILTDKLLSFIDKDKTTTLYGINYSSADLCSQYFRKIFEEVCGDDIPDEVVICIPTVTVKLVNGLTECIKALSIDENHIHVISRSEAFIYYSMSQTKDFHNNNVALFSLEDNDLTYYEMKIQRKPKNAVVFADMEQLDESFNIEIKNTPSGAKLADSILVSCTERLFKNKIFSAVLLTGKGFQELDWAPEFTKLICKRRRVFVDDEIFSRGAGFRGADYASEKPIFQFAPICDGRVDSSIYININRKDRTLAYPIINVGDPWYRVNRTIRVIPTESNSIEMTVVPMDERMRRTIKIPIDFIPSRPPKATVLSIGLHFNNSHNMTVSIEDCGFGELFPGTHLLKQTEVELWD